MIELIKVNYANKKPTFYGGLEFFLVAGVGFEPTASSIKQEKVGLTYGDAQPS
jgi:hypothetical protein